MFWTHLRDQVREQLTDELCPLIVALTAYLAAQQPTLAPVEQQIGGAS